MNEQSWRQDPRLATMDPTKLVYLTDFAKRISGLPRDQVLSAFMSMQLEARNHGIIFSDEETGLLVSVISADMTPGERKWLETLRVLAKKLAARSS